MREHLFAHCPSVKSGPAAYAQRIAKMLTLGGFMEKPSVAQTTVPETLWRNDRGSDRLLDHGLERPIQFVSYESSIDF